MNTQFREYAGLTPEDNYIIYKSELQHGKVEIKIPKVVLSYEAVRIYEFINLIVTRKVDREEYERIYDD